MASLPPGALMQRAATGLAVACADYLGAVYGARVLILAGAGDNGGDALWAGARLAGRGVQVHAVFLGEHAHEQGAAALRAAGGRIVSEPDWGGYDLAVDLIGRLSAVLAVGLGLAERETRRQEGCREHTGEYEPAFHHVRSLPVVRLICCAW